jgi:hypothetical protein
MTLITKINVKGFLPPTQDINFSISVNKYELCSSKLTGSTLTTTVLKRFSS